MKVYFFSPFLLILLGSSVLFSQDLNEVDSSNFIELDLYEYYETISEQNEICQDEISSFIGRLSTLPKFPHVKSLITKLFQILEGYGELFPISDINLFEQELIQGEYSLDSFYLLCEDCFNIKNKHNKFLADNFFDLDENQFKYDSRKLNEFAFYRIEPKDVIAEIGVGNGYNVEILSLVYPQNQIYANELMYQQIEYLQRQLRGNPHIEIIRGESTSCGLEDMGIDILIARNSIHHFENKTEMIDSMADSLNKEGRLIVLERFVDSNGFFCEHAMERQEFIDFMRARGFVIKRYQNIYDDSELMEFELSD